MNLLRWPRLFIIVLRAGDNYHGGDFGVNEVPSEEFQ
jgi:hypothetical protein